MQCKPLYEVVTGKGMHLALRSCFPLTSAVKVMGSRGIELHGSSATAASTGLNNRWALFPTDVTSAGAQHKFQWKPLRKPESTVRGNVGIQCLFLQPSSTHTQRSDRYSFFEEVEGRRLYIFLMLVGMCKESLNTFRSYWQATPLSELKNSQHSLTIFSALGSYSVWQGQGQWRCGSRWPLLREVWPE